MDKFVKWKNGIWSATILCLPAGHYRYKFVIDGAKWVEDLSRSYKDNDEFNGFNSVFNIS